MALKAFMLLMNLSPPIITQPAPPFIAVEDPFISCLSFLDLIPPQAFLLPEELFKLEWLWRAELGMVEDSPYCSWSKLKA
jgi:hypothetical protein